MPLCERTRYQKQASTVRNMRAVRKTGSWGTRRIFGSIRCKKQASTVRKGHSVHENPLFLHGRRFQRNSVLKTGFYGTEEIFGAKNSLLWYAMHFQRLAEQSTPQTVDSLLGYATHFRRRAVPKAAPAAPDASSVRETAPLSLFAPATPSPAPSTALGTRNGPRSEVSRHKKETKVKDFDLFCRGTVTRTQDPLVPNQMR